MSLPAYQDHELELQDLYYVLAIIAESFVYGVYSCLVPIFVFVMLTKGLRTRVRKILFFMSLFMYFISTVNWSLSVANTILLYKNDFLSPASQAVASYLPLFSAISLVNYFLTDGVVVWRAWVLCSESRGALRIPVTLLFCLAISVTITVAFRIRLTVSPISEELNRLLSRGLSITQIANLILSLFTNISATTIISMKAWKFRRDIRKLAHKSTTGNRIMAMIVESGILYCVSGITVLLASLIRIESGTLGDIYTPVTFQIAGIYPIFVILLVNQGSSMDKTVFMSTIQPRGPLGGTRNQNHESHRETHLETMRFEVPISTVNSGRLSLSSEAESHIDENEVCTGSKIHFSTKEKSLPDVPLSSNGSIRI